MTAGCNNLFYLLENPSSLEDLDAFMEAGMDIGNGMNSVIVTELLVSWNRTLFIEG
jgi:hypothetical protein